MFKNHQPRQLEGTYRFMLPAGAAIARLAMDVNGQMMEGEIVEREKARNIYESIVRARKDPALLEWDGGNRFTTRIFPIPARGTKTVVLAYEQLLPQDDAKVRYRYQLPSLVGENNPERIGKFAFRLDASQAQRIDVAGYDAATEGTSATVSATDFVPNGPVEVNLLAASGVSSAVVAEQAVGKPGEQQPHHVFGVDWVPEVDAAGRTRGDLVIAIDSSASVGDVELDRAVKAAMALAAKHDSGRKVMAVYGDLSVYACELSPWSAGTQAEVGLASCLNTRMARGASDLRWLIGAAMQAAEQLDDADVVLFADGAPSVGELDADLILAEASARAARVGARLHTMAIGHSPDEELLRQLARAAGGHSGRLLPSADPAVGIEELRWRLGLALIEDVAVEVVSGEVQDLIPPPAFVARGEPALVMGRLASQGATLRFSGTYAGQQLSHEVQVNKKAAKEAPIVGRFWARAKIGQQMTARAPREEVVTTSIDWGVMSPFTSFLVLENERMYEQNAIDRRKKTEREQQVAKKDQPKAFRKSKERLQDVLGKNNAEGRGGKLALRAEKPADLGGLADVFGDGDDGAPMAMEEAAPAAAPMKAAKGGAPEMDADRAFAKTASSKAAKKKRRAPRRDPAASSQRDMLNSGSGGVSTRGRGDGNASYGASKVRLGETAPQQGRVGVVFGAYEIDGIDEVVVRRVLSERSKEIEYCAAREQVTGGKMAVSFTVTADGRVDSPSVSGKVAPGVRRCVQQRLQRMRLPRPPSGFAQVQLTIGLSTKDTMLVVDGELTTLKQAIAKPRRLSAAGLIDVLSALLARNEIAKAKKVYKLLDKKLAKASAQERFRALANTRLVGQFPNETFDALLALVQAEAAGPAEIFRFQHQMDLKRSVRLADIAKPKAPPPLLAKAILDVLDPAVRAERSRELTEAWVQQSGWTAADELQVVSTTVADPWRHARAFELATQLVASSATVDEDVLATLIDSAARLNKQKEAGAVVADACRSARLAGDRCLRFIDAEGVTDADRALFLLLARRADLENKALLDRMAGVLDKLGAALDADRVRSEQVEFSPRDIDKRRQYFTDLRARGQNEQACLQAATLVQLNPAERDMFRAMMDLSRNDAEARGSIKRCITEGVSMLPVRRDISVVLTWEDPEADIDMHITEPGGEKVNFSHRESKAGGLLYYDVRNGLGPEIYTLGEAPKGELSLGLVYYAGTAKEVPVTMTVMRNAGAPEETREVFEVVLRGANPDVLKPVTKLQY